MTELKNILPFCKDINNMIIERAKPYRFEIGSYYRYKRRGGFYKILRKTKCFVHFCFVLIETDIKISYNMKRKVRYDKYNNEYFCLDTFFLNDSKYCVYAKNKKVFD
jgi:hypothetical protein